MNIEKQLKQLRKEWKEKPKLRPIIERRAKLLKMAAKADKQMKIVKDVFLKK